MSEQTAKAAGTEAQATEETNTEQAKPTETVDFWKQKAREQEKRAKDNAEAAKQLSEIQDAQKTEAEKTADRIAKAEAEVSTIPSKVADALRDHLVTLHEIDKEDAELFLTASEPELLLKQVARLLSQSDTRRNRSNVSPREGQPTRPAGNEDERFARNLFAGG